jgi:S-(hydroxymethyl)glutathione dehydrogenase/alcohol dehydrogenase
MNATSAIGQHGPMKAAIFRQTGQALTIEDVQIDKPRGREVLIRTAAVGVCHSTALHRRHLPVSVTLHSRRRRGIVEQVGPEVRTVKPGDHVITCLSIFCGHCEHCVTGHLSRCVSPETKRGKDDAPRISLADKPVAQLVGLGAFAEQMLVHENGCVAIRKDMPLDRAALIGCAVMTGYGAATHTSNVRPGDTVAVIGCGGIGLSVINGACWPARAAYRHDRLPAA